MLFSIENQTTEIDDNGGEETVTVIDNYRCQFTDGLIEVFSINEDDSENKVAHQPWKFDEFSNRSPFDSIEEGVEWFKSNNDQGEG
jgi:hypothetical protein